MKLNSAAAPAKRRRHWTVRQKVQWVMRTMEPGTSLSSVAREAGINVSQLFQWRKAYNEGLLSVADTSLKADVSATDLERAAERIKHLENILGQTMQENSILRTAVNVAVSKNWVLTLCFTSAPE